MAPWTPIKTHNAEPMILAGHVIRQKLDTTGTAEMALQFASLGHSAEMRYSETSCVLLLSLEAHVGQ